MLSYFAVGDSFVLTGPTKACILLSNLTIYRYGASDFVDQGGIEGFSGVPGGRAGADDHGLADRRARRKSRQSQTDEGPGNRRVRNCLGVSRQCVSRRICRAAWGRCLGGPCLSEEIDL